MKSQLDLLFLILNKEQARLEYFHFPLTFHLCQQQRRSLCNSEDSFSFIGSLLHRGTKSAATGGRKYTCRVRRGDGGCCSNMWLQKLFLLLLLIIPVWRLREGSHNTSTSSHFPSPFKASSPTHSLEPWLTS